MRLKATVSVLALASAIACGTSTDDSPADSGTSPANDAGSGNPDGSSPSPPDAGGESGAEADAGTPPDAGPAGTDLSILITGVKNSSVDLCVAVFKDGVGFPDNEAAAIFRDCQRYSPQPFTVPGLVAGGSYAVSVFLDENGNKQLDKSPLGFPSEGFGFSRNPSIGTSAPKWSDVSFTLDPSAASISIKAVYCSLASLGCK